MAEVTQLLPRRRQSPAPTPETPKDETRVVRAVEAQPAAPTPLRLGIGNSRSQSVRVGTVIKERFELTELLGVGGMGVVYKALDRRQSELGEADPWVAIKVLNSSLARENYAMAALQQECRRSQKLAHPCIVNVHDFDRDGDRVFMTMECLAGESLEERLQPDMAGLSFAQVRCWLSDIGEALCYAHRQGVVHSDLKPSNIFITEDGHAKVFDFGIARAMQSAQSPTSNHAEAHEQADERTMIAYTPAYASLAMLRGSPPDPADDAYALACVLYQLLSGRHPYQRRTADAVVQDGMVPERLPMLSRRQWRVLARLLRPQHRHSQGVSELLAVFCEPTSGRVRTLAIAVSLLVGTALGGAIIDQIQHRARYQLAEHLQSAQLERVQAGLDQLAGLPIEDRIWVLDASRESLLADLQVQVARNPEPHASINLARLLEQVADYFPDSLQLVLIRQQHARQQQQRVEGVLAEIERLLKNALPTTRAVQELAQHWHWLALWQPERFGGMHDDYLEAVAQQANRLLYAEQPDIAHSLLEHARRFWPDSDGLANVAARVARYRQDPESAPRIGSTALPMQTHHLAALTRLQEQAAAGTGLQSLLPELVHLYRDVDSQLGEVLETALIAKLNGYLVQPRTPRAIDARDSLRALGRLFAPQNPAFQEPVRRVDPCRAGGAGKGEWAAHQCRDRLTADQWGPSLVVVPGMPGASAYAISQHEISVAEFNLFCRLFRQCEERSEPANLPVTGVSVAQVRGYLHWLSRLSGRQYRLPDRRRWLHAVTADGVSPIADHQCRVEHAGQLIRGGKPRPVDQGQLNGWGLRNGLGNVAEWVDEQGILGIVGGHFELPLSHCQPHTYQVDAGSASQTTGFRVMRGLGDR